MRSLILYENYSRKEVHDIFVPLTSFVPQRGTWGIHGIVSIPDRLGDYVFFVTFGQQQGEHVFDEGVTVDGVLSWQSQPRQSLRNHQIQQLIKHDELCNSIYLFLRTRGSLPYTYLGKLKYLSHDSQREHPVYFQWQILDWNIPPDVLKRIGLVLQPPTIAPHPVIQSKKDKLEETPAPRGQPRTGVSTSSFKTRKNADYSERDAKNRELGRAGELLVIDYERKYLAAQGRDDLAEKVHHVSQFEGDGAGYDVLSFTPNGEEVFIEVKTTSGRANTPFFMSSNEVEFSQSHQAKYLLYRLYEYDTVTDTAKFFRIADNIQNYFSFTPTEYRVSMIEQKPG